MLPTPDWLLEDEAEVARLVERHPWATFVSPTTNGLVASHYPVLLDPAADGLTILSHFGRPDEKLHELGRHEILVIVQGPHDYVSPSWYAEGDDIPTWNHVTAHLYGTPEIMEFEENWATLQRLVRHFESGMDHPREMGDERRTAKGTVGVRLRVTRFEARAKLSQNKAPEVRANIIDHLRDRQPDLAHEMERYE